MKISTVVHCAAALIVASGPLACQSYVPLMAEPAVGQSVRAQLTPPGAVRQAQVTGVARTSLEAIFVGARDDALALQVPILGLVPELQRSPKVADTLLVLKEDIASLEAPRFSALRTAGFIAALGGAVALAFAISGDAGGDQSTDPTGTVTFAPSLRILSFPIGR